MVEYIIQCYSLNSSHLILPPTVSTSPFFTSVSLFSQLQSCVWLFVIPWTVARQAPLSMQFSRHECWKGLHFHLQGIFPTQGSNPDPGIVGRFFTFWATREAPPLLYVKLKSETSEKSAWLLFSTESAGQSHRNEYRKYKFPWPPSGESGLENLEGGSDEYLHKSNMGFQFSPLTENHREGKSLKGDLPNS